LTAEGFDYIAFMLMALYGLISLYKLLQVSNTKFDDADDYLIPEFVTLGHPMRSPVLNIRFLRVTHIFLAETKVLDVGVRKKHRFHH
jgi:hypothetical protein